MNHLVLVFSQSKSHEGLRECIKFFCQNMNNITPKPHYTWIQSLLALMINEYNQLENQRKSSILEDFSHLVRYSQRDFYSCLFKSLFFEIESKLQQPSLYQSKEILTVLNFFKSLLLSTRQGNSLFTTNNKRQKQTTKQPNHNNNRLKENCTNPTQEYNFCLASFDSEVYLY